jgi:heterokaryon incompatibility protein (HET)
MPSGLCLHFNLHLAILRFSLTARSINQSNILERGHQVSNMLQIFQNATKVLVWIDGGNHPNMVATVIETICLVSEQLLKCLKVDIESFDGLEDLTQFVRNESHRLEPLDVTKDEGVWSSLVWFYSKPWFSRVWVIQEVNCGSICEILFSSHSINWRYAAIGINYLLWHGNMSLLIKVEPAILRKLWLAEALFCKFQSCSGRNWLQLLVFASRRLATDNRDHIYGLLGLRGFAEASGILKADYSREAKDIFADLTLQTIEKEECLDILLLVEHNRKYSNDGEYPSWVPKFHHNIWLCAVNKHWSSKDSGMPLKLSTDHAKQSITVWGYEVDTISDLYDYVAWPNLDVEDYEWGPAPLGELLRKVLQDLETTTEREEDRVRAMGI